MAELDFPDSPTVGQVYDRWTWNGTMWVLTASGAAPADTRGYTFYQDATPTTTRTGDTWYVPSTGVSNVWSGTAWVKAASSTDTDTRGYTFFQAGTPTATRVGDTWYSTTDNYSRVWTGSQWYATGPAFLAGVPLRSWSIQSNNNAFTTTSTVAQAIDFLTINVPARAFPANFKVEALLWVGWNAGNDDCWFGLDAGPGAQITPSAGGYQRGDGNTLTMRAIPLMGFYAPGHANAFQFRVHCWVRHTGAQLFVNRRGADSVVGTMSTHTVTEYV